MAQFYHLLRPKVPNLMTDRVLIRLATFPAFQMPACASIFYLRQRAATLLARQRGIVLPQVSLRLYRSPSLF